MSPLSINKISKSFKKKHVLDDISFEVQAGEIFGLVGLNGVGKTTLIKIILGLLAQDKGNITFFGENNLTPKARRNLAYLPEKFYPSGYLKGKEFLQFAVSFYGKTVNLNEAREKADRLNLNPDMLDNQINKYSKGMGQKLGLISAFLSDVPFLLLDEPMSGLDPQARIQLKSLLRDYKAQGKTIFFSSHILADIEEICDSMAIIHNGHIAYHGAPDKLLKQHKEKSLERAFLKTIEG